MFPDIRPIQTHVERTLVEFPKIEKPSIADYMAYRTRLQIGDVLDHYRAHAKQMSDDELIEERHSSRRLKNHMRRSGDPCPSPRCDCHHMVSGGQKAALMMRLVLAAYMRLYCTEEVKGAIEKARLSGLFITPDLANIFPMTSSPETL